VQVPTAGLLNVIGAPHLTVGSTYLPSYTGRAESDSVRKHHSSPEVAAALQSLNDIGYPPKVSIGAACGIETGVFLNAATRKHHSSPPKAGYLHTIVTHDDLTASKKALANLLQLLLLFYLRDWRCLIVLVCCILMPEVTGI
jgi:hypothetical protein